MKDITVENFNRSNLTEWIQGYSHKEKVELAVYSTDLVIGLCSGNSEAPKNAIKAAKNWISNPSEENRNKCIKAIKAVATANSVDVAARATARAATYTDADDDVTVTVTATAAHAAVAATNADVTAVTKQKIIDYIINKGKTMKTKIEYVRVDMTNSEIAKAMIDGEVFYSQDGNVKYAWNGGAFFSKDTKSGILGRISSLSDFLLYNKTETPTDKWDDAAVHLGNAFHKNYLVEDEDDIIIDARMTKEQWLDFAHILLESE